MKLLIIFLLFPLFCLAEELQLSSAKVLVLTKMLSLESLEVQQSFAEKSLTGQKGFFEEVTTAYDRKEKEVEEWKEEQIIEAKTARLDLKKLENLKATTNKQVESMQELVESTTEKVEDAKAAYSQARSTGPLVVAEKKWIQDYKDKVQPLTIEQLAEEKQSVSERAKKLSDLGAKASLTESNERLQLLLKTSILRTELLQRKMNESYKASLESRIKLRETLK